MTPAVLNNPQLTAKQGDALDSVRIERFAGPDQPLDVGVPRTVETVPGKACKDRSKIMTTPFIHVLVAVASVATVYCAVATSGNAREDDMRAVAYVSAELVQWHSGLTVTSDSYVKPKRKSTRSAIDPEDSTAFLVMHGAAGIRDVAEDRFGYSIDSFDAPKGTRKSTRNPAGIRDGSAQRAR